MNGEDTMTDWLHLIRAEYQEIPWPAPHEAGGPAILEPRCDQVRGGHRRARGRTISSTHAHRRLRKSKRLIHQEGIMLDKDLQQHVQNALDWEPMVDAKDIGVSVEGGVVTLRGNVASYAEKI